MSEQTGNQKIKRIIKAALGEFRIELTIVVDCQLQMNDNRIVIIGMGYEV